jgi:hypothetical protein
MLSYGCIQVNVLFSVESVKDVKIKLAKQEDERLKAEKKPLPITVSDYGNLVVLGIDIQKSQYVKIMQCVMISYTIYRRSTSKLLSKLKGSTSERDKDRQELALARLTMKISHLVRMQRELQLSSLDNVHVDRTQEDPLLFRTGLPSDLTDTQRATACPSELISIETSLRHAYALEALESMLDNLRTKMSLQGYKKKNVRGVAQATRANSTMSGLQKSVLEDADEYRAHRAALLKLRGKGEWESELRELHSSDIRGMNTDEPSKRDLRNNLAAQLRGLTVVDNDARGDVSSETFLDETVQPLKGAVHRGSRFREVSWIWLGRNLSDGSRDPECKC